MDSKSQTHQNWVIETFDQQVRFGFPRSEILFSEKSTFQTVEVVASPTHGKILLNDGCFMLSERDEAIYHEMMAHVPLFLHPNPKKALVIGGGDGGTAREILRHTHIEKCVLVEIDEAVVRACKEFIPQTANAFQSPRLKTFIEDGVEWAKNAALKVKQGDQDAEKFDIICVDSTDPVGFAQPLFGNEFYADLKTILSDDGIIVSQGESPFYAEKMQETLAKVLKNNFKRVHFYNFTNMTYPGGLWSFSYASDSIHPLDDFSRSKVASSGMEFQYYNLGIHEAAFMIPEFQKKKLSAYLNPL
jgi:spermidine synthase